MIEQDLTKIGCHGNWRRYKNNPILKDDWGETFDVTVIQALLKKSSNLLFA